MKKKFAYLLVAALSVSLLAGCGSKSSETKKTSKVEIELAELFENVADATSDIEDLQLDIKGEADATVKVDGQSLSAKGSVSLTGKAVKEEPAFDLSGAVDYSVTTSGTTLSGKYSANACGETEDGELNVYVNVNKGDEKGNWVTDSMDASYITDVFDDLEEILEESKDAFNEITEEDWKKVESILKLEDMTKIVNKKECYVITMEINNDSIMELIRTSEDYVDEEEMEDALQEAEEAFQQLNLDCRGQICYDKDTFLPVQTKISFTMNGEVDDTEVDIKTLVFEMNMLANDGVKLSGVPDNVKEEAEEADLDLDDYFPESDDETDSYDWEEN